MHPMYTTLFGLPIQNIPIPHWFAQTDWPYIFFQKNEKTEKHGLLYLPSWTAYSIMPTGALGNTNLKILLYSGGDGGMEYPMATLILGEGNLNGLVGVSVHELMHSWYQMTLGTNESLYAWMDEGFTDYATDEIMNFLKEG